MLENPTATLNVFDSSCAKMTYKHVYLANHSELITGTYELSFLTIANNITSHNTELPPESPLVWFGLV
jgi:CHAT domain-containing protein